MQADAPGYSTLGCLSLTYMSARDHNRSSMSSTQAESPFRAKSIEEEPATYCRTLLECF